MNGSAWGRIWVKRNVEEEVWGMSETESLLWVFSYSISRSYKKIKEIFILWNTITALHCGQKWFAWRGSRKRNPMTSTSLLCSQFSSYSMNTFFLQSCLQPDYNWRKCLCCTGRTIWLLTESCSRECCAVTSGLDLKVCKLCFQMQFQ